MRNAGLKYAFAVGLVLAAAARPAQATDASDVSSAALTRAGDMLQFGVPLSAFALTFLYSSDDADEPADEVAFEGRTALEFDLELTGSPRRDLVVALARTHVATYGLKYGINADRPNGAGHSFPSGHTAAAFSGAEFIRKQYGLVPGIAAYGSAAFVGWTRVASRNHWTHDVLAGAVIGIMSNHDTLRWQGTLGTFTVSPGLFVAPSRIADRIPDPQPGQLISTLQFRLDF